jgi:hypothetical protein
VGISSTNQENYVQILLLVVVSSGVMVMPVCLFFCVFLFSSLRLFEELFLRERERGSRWIDVGVLPVLLVCLAWLGWV